MRTVVLLYVYAYTVWLQLSAAQVCTLRGAAWATVIWDIAPMLGPSAGKWRRSLQKWPSRWASHTSARASHAASAA